MYNPTPQQLRALNIGIILTIVASVLFLALYFVGSGTLTVNTPPGTTASINGHVITQKTVKVRPATYRIIVQSSRYVTYDSHERVLPFQKKTLTPSLRERTPDDVAQAALGVYGLYGPPVLSRPQWHEKNTWLTATVGPGSPSVAAFHYTEGKWQVGYSNIPGYPSDTAELPAVVAQAVNNLMERLTTQ